jgi:hypothetical protein
LKQIIKHSVKSTETSALLEEDYQYNHEPAENSSYYSQGDDLLEPMNIDDDDDDNELGETLNSSAANRSRKQNLPSTKDMSIVMKKKGQRVGAFFCKICVKSFKYIKPFKNHMQIHEKDAQTQAKPVSYYKRKKYGEAAYTMNNQKPAQVKKSTSKPKSAPLVKEEPQPDYDSLSPYNSPAPYEEENFNRDSSPDMGEFMLKSLMGNEDIDDNDEDDEDSARKAKNKSSRTWKRGNEDDYEYKPNRKMSKTTVRKSTGKVQSVPAAVATSNNKKRAGPLSKTKKPSIDVEDTEEASVSGFREVDINKMLKKKISDTNITYRKCIKVEQIIFK